MAFKFDVFFLREAGACREGSSLDPLLLFEISDDKINPASLKAQVGYE